MEVNHWRLFGLKIGDIFKAHILVVVERKVYLRLRMPKYTIVEFIGVLLLTLIMKLCHLNQQNY